MKKWIYPMIAICLAAALVGCGRQGDPETMGTENTQQDPTQTTSMDVTEETKETEETLSHNTGEPEMDFSDFE